MNQHKFCLNAYNQVKNAISCIIPPEPKVLLMGFFEKFVVGKEKRWIWFGLTVLGGFIPIITTLIFASGEEGYYKLVDIVFLGLTLNISNLNLVGGLEFVQKDVVVILSAIFMVVLCLCLGKIYSQSVLSVWLELGIWLTAFASIYINFEINNFVFKNVIKK